MDKERKSAGKSIQKAKEATTKAATQTVAKTADSGELKALAAENNESKTKLEQLSDQIIIHALGNLLDNMSNVYVIISTLDAVLLHKETTDS